MVLLAWGFLTKMAITTSQVTYPNYYYDWINEEWVWLSLCCLRLEARLPAIYCFIQITNEEDFGHD